MTLDEKVTEEVSMLWYLTKTLKQLFKCAKKKKDKELKKTEKTVLTKPEYHWKEFKKRTKNFGFEKYNY